MADYTSAASIASGEEGGLDSLLRNKLFISYLSGAGGAMSAGKPIGPALNEITQQNIGAQSKAKLQKRYMQMLAQILKGGGDIKLGKDKTTINAPSSMYGGLGSELANADEHRLDMYPQESGVGEIARGLRTEGEGTSPSSFSPTRSPEQEMVSYLNPSSSPLDDISGADLAGLTAADVSQALSGAVGVQSLKQRTMADIADAVFRQKQFGVDSAYKDQLIRESAARTKKYGEVEPISPLDQPFVSGLTLRQYNALTADTKEYVLAKEGAKLLGDSTFMSQREWEALEPTERERFVRATMKDPKLMEAAKELAKTEQPEQRRPLVSWTTATQELTKRFGKLDPTGMWAVTPELQVAHNKAQEFLVENKRANMEPLEAVNEANKRARTWIADREKRFYEYMEAVQKIKNKTERVSRAKQIQEAYLNEFGYVPSARR